VGLEVDQAGRVVGGGLQGFPSSMKILRDRGWAGDDCGQSTREWEGVQK